MTVVEISAAVATQKPVCQRQVQRYIREIGIKPLGVRQRPQRYPDDTAERILSHLGFVSQYRNGGILSVKEAKRRAA